MGAFLDPMKVLEAVNVRPGMRVVDFGSGHGYYTIPLAKRLGEKGKIWAFDVQETAVEAVRSHARLQHLGNVEALRADLEKPGATGLNNETADLVILANILFQAEEKQTIIAEAKRILKKEGEILIIEWNEGSSPLGPPASVRISKETAQHLMREAGLQKEREFDAGGWHYGLVFKKLT